MHTCSLSPATVVVTSSCVIFIYFNGLFWIHLNLFQANHFVYFCTHSLLNLLLTKVSNGRLAQNRQWKISVKLLHSHVIIFYPTGNFKYISLRNFNLYYSLRFSVQVMRNIRSQVWPPENWRKSSTFSSLLFTNIAHAFAIYLLFGVFVRTRANVQLTITLSRKYKFKLFLV